MLVICDQIGAASKKFVAEEFKEWSEDCEIQPPPSCDTPENLEEIQQQSLQVSEGVLYAATSDNIGPMHFPQKQYD